MFRHQPRCNVVTPGTVDDVLMNMYERSCQSVGAIVSVVLPEHLPVRDVRMADFFRNDSRDCLPILLSISVFYFLVYIHHVLIIILKKTGRA